MAPASNKPVVFEFLERGFGQGDLSVFERLVAEDYIQHNPFIQTGRKGLLAFREVLQTFEDNEFRPIRVIEDDPIVLLHCEWRTGAQRRAVFEMLRVHNGQLVEHWDAMQDQPASTPHGRTMLDGPAEVIDHDKTERNKALVRDFVNAVLIEGRHLRLAEFFDGDRYIQHSPNLADGVAALRAHLSAGQNGGTAHYNAIHRLVGEGNFVLAQCAGVSGGTPCAFYDLYRLENGKLAEHWDIVQPIPATFAHNNGMF
ncbi:nuclear transport factor 2 family protein [Bradyrhizobium sp. BR 1432]|uniref:nuclear transport factor 2 family protein n=1 Tax=Bradyrhizobium sp. BR 1432 TaxID=3447966 RepID=UPI003EE7F481